MAGREWTVEVRANNKKSRNDGVYFRVVLPGVKKGAPLRAKPNDVLVLSNRTDWDLAFESTDPPNLVDFDLTIRFSDAAGPFPIPPGIPVITYRCKDPEQFHTIEMQ